MFSGSMVALVTPMSSAGAIDYQRLGELIEWHIESKTQALVVLGTTGESATISDQERAKLVPWFIDRVNNRVPVIVGTGSNVTEQSIERTLNAQSQGADACLLVTPYYNKPTQEGLFQHFSAIASKASIPQILYNVPSRTGIDLSVECTVRLNQAHGNIVGIKDATQEWPRMRALKEMTDLELYSGDDLTAFDFMHAGGQGVISVTANVFPKAMSQMASLLLAGNIEQARDINNKLMTWYRLLFIESNPIPSKWMMEQMGKIEAGIRLPLTWLSETAQQTLKHHMASCDLIKEEGICV